MCGKAGYVNIYIYIFIYIVSYMIQYKYIYLIYLYTYIYIYTYNMYIYILYIRWRHILSQYHPTARQVSPFTVPDCLGMSQRVGYVCLPEDTIW